MINIADKIIRLSEWLKTNYNTIIFIVIALMSTYVAIILGLYSWGFIANGLYGMHFPVETCLSFTTVLVTQLVALATYAYSANKKYYIDSNSNSEQNKPAYKEQITQIIKDEIDGNK